MADTALTPQRASFTDVLLSIAQGRFNDEATQALSGLVKEMNRVVDIGGGKAKGRVVLTLDLVLDRGVMQVEPGVRVTTPKTPRALTIMYTTPDGRLTKHDTKQGSLDLDNAKDVTSQTTIRDIRSTPRDGRAAAANDT